MAAPVRQPGAGAVHLELSGFDGGPAAPVESGPLESLGFDVVSIDQAQPKGGPYDYLPFSCAPLSCNGMGKDYSVNRWCLLEGIEQALKATRDFAADPPEPGPFVVVEVLR